MNKRITGFVGSLVLASSALSFVLIPEANAGKWRCCKNVQSCGPNQVREKEKAKGFKIFNCKDACRCRNKTAEERAADADRNNENTNTDRSSDRGNRRDK